MKHIFALTNHKGGVGKSTSATNIALGIVGILHNAGAANPRVLLIDTDSQAHATLVTTGRNNYGTDNSLYAVLMAERQAASQVLANCIAPSKWDENLHVLPASPLLEQAERELQGTAGAPYRLADPLAKIAPHYAAVVIDTCPSFSLMTEMALIAATDAIVPVEPRYLETVGLLSVIGKINEIREGWRIQNLRIRGLLVTKMDKRVRGHRQLLNELKEHPMLGKLLLGVIPMNEAISYAHREHRSIFTYDPLLLLTVHDHEIPNHAVTNDFYRQALELDLRGKREYTDAILSAMGGISRARFSRFKALLNISDEAMALADRHHIEEGKLRYVLAFPKDDHVEVIRQVIDFDLTVKQVKLLGQQPDSEENSANPHTKFYARVAKVFRLATKESPQGLAESILTQEGDVHSARAQLQRMRDLLDAIEIHLNH